jgi:DNA phosphorothioation-dependent restriction protein DptG
MVLRKFKKEYEYILKNLFNLTQFWAFCWTNQVRVKIQTLMKFISETFHVY